MSPAKKAAGGARKAAASTTTDENAPDDADQAPEGVTTLGGARQGGTEPQPADDPDDVVNLTGPGGTKVTAPTRIADTLKQQGFK